MINTLRRWLAPLACDAIGLSGIGLLVAGFASFSTGLGLIAAGGALLTLSLLWARRG